MKITSPDSQIASFLLRIPVSCRPFLQLISCLLFLTFLGSQQAHAWPKFFRRIETVLFDSKHNPHIFYEKIISNLEPGQIFVFSNGRRIEVKSILSKDKPGFRSVIVEDALSGNAFRLSLKASRWYGKRDLRRHLESFQETMRQLNQDGAPSVKVISHYSWEYVEVETVDVETNLTDFLQSYPRVNKKMYEDLLTFAAQTAIYTNIGDAKSENIVYVRNRGWILLDVGEGIFYYRTDRPHNKLDIVQNNSLFTSIRQLIPPELMAQLAQTVRSARNLSCNEITSESK